MKKQLTYISVFMFMLLSFTWISCTNVLNQDPVDKFSEATLWSDINLAEPYLLAAYDNSNYQFFEAQTDFLTDNAYFRHSEQNYASYLQGDLTADNPYPLVKGGFPWWEEFFGNIQNINLLLANIDQLPGAYPESEQDGIRQNVELFKGEAYFLRAYNYYRVLENYGGIPLFDEPNVLGEDFSSKVRASFEETINFIVEDLNKASVLLGTKEEMEMGRATKGTALALKSRVLLFAASDLAADGTAENKYVGYENPDRMALWTAARNAAKEVMDLGIYHLADFGGPDQDVVAENYYDFFRQKDLSSPEVIWGKMFLVADGVINGMNGWNNINGNGNWNGCNPTQDLADAYQMTDGSSFFDNFMVDGNGYYRNISNNYTSENIYHHREPRFYGSILSDSIQWQERNPALQGRDPLGIYDWRTRIVIENGVEVERIYGIDTPNSDQNPGNAGLTGYAEKKQLDKDERVDPSQGIRIVFRYAEVLLNYAEASLELGNESEATTYINMIRNRVGLPNFTGDIEEALRYERRVEFTFEGLRWIDIRRWKILDEVMKDAKGVDIVQTTEDGVTTTTWQQTMVQPREAVDKMYWLPIPRQEINRAPQLIQNPGY